MVRYIVCYDISDNDLRTEVAKILKGPDGLVRNRVQRSVFEISEERVDAVLAALDSKINPDAGFLAVYRVCDTCEGDSFYFGTPPKISDIRKDEVQQRCRRPRLDQR